MSPEAQYFSLFVMQCLVCVRGMIDGIMSEVVPDLLAGLQFELLSRF